jgi:hypothetical protein
MPYDIDYAHHQINEQSAHDGERLKIILLIGMPQGVVMLSLWLLWSVKLGKES